MNIWNLNTWLQLVGMTTGLLGNYLITSANPSGFVVWMVSNVALLWLQIRLRMWVLLVLFAVYLVLCFQGLGVWYRKTPEVFPDWMPRAFLEMLSAIF